MNYSVLMSVYHKEKPEYLRQSMNSMFEQSVPTDDFVLVCDGPLDEELDEVIDEMQKKYPDILNVVRLEKNVGLGKALQTGVLKCRNGIIARMDSDDIARPNRCEIELDYLNQHSEIAIVGSHIEEFIGGIDCVTAQRIVPEKNDDIIHTQQAGEKVSSPKNTLSPFSYKSTRTNLKSFDNIFAISIISLRCLGFAIFPLPGISPPDF